jgi:molybdenum cofactor cytidylyltransferase
MIFGLLPAAGKSARMGRPKLSLPLGGRTVLHHTIAALRQGGVELVLVVVAPHSTELATLAEAAGATCLVLRHKTPDMRATVEQGLAWLELHFQPQLSDSFLLIPADHPTLDAAVVRALLETHVPAPPGSILVPTHAGRRGHPTLIPWEHVAGIRARPPGEGVNAYLRGQAARTIEVALASDAILCDLDTPEDYDRLLRGFRPES